MIIASHFFVGLGRSWSIPLSLSHHEQIKPFQNFDKDNLIGITVTVLLQKLLGFKESYASH